MSLFDVWCFTSFDWRRVQPPHVIKAYLATPSHPHPYLVILWPLQSSGLAEIHSSPTSSRYRSAMAGDIPSVMKAWLVTKNGQPKDALTLKTDYPVPSKIKAGNVLIRVSYAALNPADLNFMGNIPNWVPFRRNPIPGLDFAGEVVKVGISVPSDSGVSVGAEVCGALNVISVAVGRGSLAEYIEVPASKVVVKPKGVDTMDAAGALGIAGQTAYIVLKEAGVKAGDRVLVNGASGGVGSVLVQVAKAKGAVVFGVCSAANSEMVKGLGADEVRAFFLPLHAPARACVTLGSPANNTDELR